MTSALKAVASTQTTFQAAALVAGAPNATILLTMNAHVGRRRVIYIVRERRADVLTA